MVFNFCFLSGLIMYLLKHVRLQVQRSFQTLSSIFKMTYHLTCLNCITLLWVERILRTSASFLIHYTELSLDVSTIYREITFKKNLLSKQQVPQFLCQLQTRRNRSFHTQGICDNRKAHRTWWNCPLYPQILNPAHWSSAVFASSIYAALALL